MAALHVYPVKGCRGIALPRAVVAARGLTQDRRWMIVDEDGTFVTQRTDPVLALVDVALEGNDLVMQGPSGPSLRWRTDEAGRGAEGARRRRVNVWRDEVEAIDCGAQAAEWATRLLARPAALVFMPDDARRPVDPRYAQPGDIVSFADSFPLLVASTSSLDALNERMDLALPMDRFRPNVVLDGFAPWAEDAWARIRVGGTCLRIAKPCARCAVATTDQRTAERGVEPLRALAAFRRRGREVLFAQKAIPDGTGTLTVGDPVLPLETRTVDPFDG